MRGKGIAAVLTGSSYLSMFFLGVGTAVIGAASGNIGLSPFQTGLLVSVQNVGFIVAVLAAGALADTRSKPLLMAAGSLVLAASFFLYYRWPAYGLNLAIMTVLGAAIGTYEGVADAMLLSLHQKRQGLHISVNHFFVTFGCLAITLYLVFLQMDWRRSMVQSAVAVLALAAVFVAGRLAGGREGRAAPPSSAALPAVRSPGLRERIRVLGRERVLLLFLVLAVLAVGMESGLTGLLAVFLIQLRGYDLVASKIGLVVLLAGVASGRIVLGFISGRVRHASLLLGLNAGAAVFGGLLFFVRLPVAATGVLLFLTGASVSCMLPLLITMTGRIFPGMSGTALGVMKLGIPIGGIVVPALLSVLSRAWTFQAALGLFPLLAAAGFASLAAGWALVRRRLAAAPAQR